jgi:outer membrane protein assembly factor BamB
MRSKAAVAILLAALFSCACAAVAQEATQPGAFMLGYDASHSGYSPNPIAAPFALSWKYTPSGVQPQKMTASPAVDADSVYFFVGKSMHAVKRLTGAPKWEKPLDLPDTVDSTPVIVDETAVFGCRDGKVYFVDVNGKDKAGKPAGRILGTFDLAQSHKGFAVAGGGTATTPRVQSSPAYADGWVFFGADDGWLYAVDVATREKQWDFKANAAIKSSPACWNRGVYVASTDGRVYGLSQSTGRLKWRTKLDTFDNFSSPVVGSSKVFVSSGKYMYACDFGYNGYVRWRFEAKDNIVGSAAIYHSTLVFGDAKGKLYAVDTAADGNFKYSDSTSPYMVWQMPPEPVIGPDGQPEQPEDAVPVGGLDQPVKSSPTIVGDVVIYRAGARAINAVNLGDGKLAWHYQISEDAENASRAQSRFGGFGGFPGFGGFGGFPGFGGASSTLDSNGMPMYGPMAPGNAGLSRRSLRDSQPGGENLGSRRRRFFQQEGFGGQPVEPGGMGMGPGMGPIGGVPDFGGMGGFPGGGAFPGLGGLTTSTTPTGPTLVFEQEITPSPVVVGNDIIVLGDDGALYCFSALAADAVAPTLDSPEIEVSGQGDARVPKTLELVDPAKPSTNVYKFNGGAPVYVRIKTLDEGSGVNPQTLTITQQKGPGGVEWKPAFDAGTGHAWAVYDTSSRGVSRPLPEGEYEITIAISDWFGNTGKASVAFEVDYTQQPAAAPVTMRPQFPSMFPGMEGQPPQEGQPMESGPSDLIPGPGMMPGEGMGGMGGMGGYQPPMPGMPGMP